MAYTDGLSTFQDSTRAEEVTGDLGVLQAGGAYVDVESFGIIIETTMSTNSQILKLDLDYTPQLSENPSGTANDRAAIATLTSVSGAVAGDIIVSKDTSFPFRMGPGSHMTIKVNTAGGASTGDYRPFLVYRVAGTLNPASVIGGAGGTLTFKAS